MSAKSILAALALLLLGAAFAGVLGYTGRDDSHITYFVADRLADGHTLVNLLGERQEQSSSLLFALLLAAMVAMTGIPAATLGPFVSAALLLGVAWLTACMARRFEFPRLAGPMACLTPALFYWSLSGMENSLYMLLLVALLLCLAAALACVERARPAWLVLCAVLVTLTRPEAVIVLACLGAWLAADARLRAPRLGVALVAASGGALALRLAAGLDVFPAPVYAKQHLDLGARLHAGLDYYLATARQLPASTLLVCAVAPLCVRAVRRLPRGAVLANFIRPCLALAAIIGAFALLAGGDWMEAGRFLAPLYFLVSLSALSLAPAQVRAALGVTLALTATFDVTRLASAPHGGVPLFARHAYTARHYTPSFVERYSNIHARDLPFIDAFLAALADDHRARLRIASIQGGMVPYYVKRALGERVVFRDLYGLTSRHTQACLHGWQVEPYAHLDALSACLGERFDYIFDLDDGQWTRLRLLTSQGCVALLRDERRLTSVSWKAPLEVRQFLVRCTDG